MNLTFSRYIEESRSLLEDSTWFLCGCSPYCPARRASPDDVQGTRWCSHALFDQPIVWRYSFWVKLDGDVAFLRSPRDNLLQRLLSSGPVSGHTG
ncbi:hypothetical protein TcYC6_0114600 [Trypanosoma cruzi]|nr:hypothetical protein TcYC6_0114600 [Trypanosoma cruzi]